MTPVDAIPGTDVEEPPRVLIAFYSRCGSAQALANAIGQGAVPVGAEIRLRRARELVDQDVMTRADCPRRMSQRSLPARHRRLDIGTGAIAAEDAKSGPRPLWPLRRRSAWPDSEAPIARNEHGHLFNDAVAPPRRRRKTTSRASMRR